MRICTLYRLHPEVPSPRIVLVASSFLCPKKQKEIPSLHYYRPGNRNYVLFTKNKAKPKPYVRVPDSTAIGLFSGI